MHGYGCPYHYGPLDYGPPGGLDYGEDCQCEVCTVEVPRMLRDLEFLEWGPVLESPFSQDDVALHVEFSRAAVRVPWWLRLWYWWMMRRATEEQRQRARKLALALDEALLYGERHGPSDR